jgi:hypothetical protein
MAERVAVDGPLDAGFVDGLLHGALEDSFVDVVAPDGVRARIGRAFPGREERLLAAAFATRTAAKRV